MGGKDPTQGVLSVFDFVQSRKYYGLQIPIANLMTTINSWWSYQKYQTDKFDPKGYMQGRKTGLHLNFIPKYKLQVKRDTDGGTVIQVDYWARIRKTGIAAAFITYGLTAAVGAGTLSYHCMEAKNFLKAFWEWFDGSYQVVKVEVLMNEENTGSKQENANGSGYSATSSTVNNYYNYGSGTTGTTQTQSTVQQQSGMYPAGMDQYAYSQYGYTGYGMPGVGVPGQEGMGMGMGMEQYGQNAYGQTAGSEYDQQNGYGQAGYGQSGYGQSGYEQNVYGQQQQAGYGQQQQQQSGYNTGSYGMNAQGEPVAAGGVFHQQTSFSHTTTTGLNTGVGGTATDYNSMYGGDTSLQNDFRSKYSSSGSLKVPGAAGSSGAGYNQNKSPTGSSGSGLSPNRSPGDVPYPNQAPLPPPLPQRPTSTGSASASASSSSGSNPPTPSSIANPLLKHVSTPTQSSQPSTPSSMLKPSTAEFVEGTPQPTKESSENDRLKRGGLGFGYTYDHLKDELDKKYAERRERMSQGQTGNPTN
ncbi:hypothetical protein PPL_05929 [Heterostelium album PN500]|uniref:Uncharacterized protein n=1 Tax=Heterostelium pallidum (strain ATCC 26659 / Pp 5 / PN500) TaxID=670386 RepID=D3BBR0_HETP5|nr:hypothetical protein PPL_05929 [Heterostelium album PN500]EFA81093.1 hypothetical protein PPL_05929 [Heterostelium album PN500]|eukprot:XP_020433211.1 hypothetical protein PPL_05929 [Heterostelium album PN500]